MIRRTLVLLAVLGTCGAPKPPPVDAQDTIQIDTAEVIVARALVRVTITPLSSRVVPGDTIIFTATGFDAAGDTVPITVEWVESGGVMDLTPLTLNTARAVVRSGTRGQRGHVTIRVLEADSLIVGWLDSVGNWRHARLEPPSVRLGESVQLCGAIYFVNGDVGVGNTTDCLLAFNTRQLSRLRMRTERWAMASRFRLALG